MKRISNTFEQSFPLPRTHCGVPLANGSMGVLIWGHDALCLTVNRSDYWDHRQGERYRGPLYQDLIKLYDPYDISPIHNAFVREDFEFNEAPDNIFRSTRLPCGRFELSLRDGLKPERAVLDYESGGLTIICDTDNLAIECCLDLNRDVLLIADPDQLIEQVRFVSAWNWVGDRMRRFGFEEPEPINSDSLCGEVQSVPTDPSLAAVCGRRADGYAISLQRGRDNAAALEHAEALIRTIDFEKVKSETSEWWRTYWNSVPTISIPDAFLNRFYTFALYKFACATHPNGIACGLQGPWVEEYQPTPWYGDFHFNVNVQQVYTLALATGNFDHLLPLFDMLESEPFQSTMRANAKHMCDIDDGLLMTHAVNDRGMQDGHIVPGATLDFACGGWMAQLYWLYYLYTQDTEFLRTRAYPFMAGIMRVFEETLEEHEGRLSLPIGISAEYGVGFNTKKDGRYVYQSVGRDPSWQLACIHMLTDALLETSDILGTEPRSIWKDIKARLPTYTLISNSGEANAGINEAGDQRIAIWECQDLDVCHRHHSHLACIYPFDTLPDPTPEQEAILDNSIDHWILRGMGQWSEWCYPWAAIIQARMGFKDAPAVLLNIWRQVFINEGWATVYLPQFPGLSSHRRKDMKKPRETNEIMQLDGTMAGATAIIEMLVHQRGDTVHLFRGIPDAWGDVSFKNVALPGAFRISAERKDGSLVNVTIKSLKGGTLKLGRGDESPMVFEFEAGEEKMLTNFEQGEP